MSSSSHPVPTGTGISPRRLRALTFILATASGLSVANIFYSQPLLDLIAQAFHTTESSAAIVVTVTQLGYAAGIIVLMPLGDLIENRALASRVLVVTAIAAGLAAVAPNLPIFLVCSVLLGFTAVVAQIVVPFAAHLAPEAARGRFVGQVMSGLLLGIMLARTVSSLLADLWGWRSVYIVSAGLMLIMAVVLATTLPSRRPDHTDGYRSLMLSIGRLIRTEPALRRRAALQALMFATFSAFWTSIAYELIKVHHLSQTEIAIFALVGAAGAAAAPVAGRLGDRGLGRPATGVVFALAAVAMAVGGIGSHHLVGLAVAAVLLDLAVQGNLVLSQQEIYQLRPDARSRINTVFIGSVFFGGAIGSALSGLLYDHLGWSGVSVLGIALSVIGFALWCGSELLRRPLRARSRPVG
ncbi:MFS transporter [Asanoa ishikariensis]|uniref:Predicted arabinose efflux permease, MFS family n=1 Tax=Asanoa ishikariensis TaxID=137265 RepID=A0A1H3MW79_9ACTN|nr:MFS transporter [Asanoa ishikariensis]GIF66384.1 MFS transporter [Asanoa ishikariensis]SDY80951.1 Predicted arabinose efflux permease, MFS family [Asanoa ishikariensis]